MAKRPADRPPTAHAVVEAFQAIEESRRPKLSRRRWLLGSAAAVLAAASLAAWGVYHWLPATVLPEDPGEVTFDYDEADGRMALQLGGEAERMVDLKREKTLSLPPGDYTLRPVADGEKRIPWPGQVIVKSGEKQRVAVQLIGEAGRHQEHGGPVRGLAVSARKDRLLVLSVSDDRRLVAWNPAGPDKPQPVWHRDSPLRCVALAADGRTAATGSGDIGPRAVQAIRFWDLDRPKLRLGDLTCRSQVNALAYSPDGKWLLSGENDGTLLLWDLKVKVVEAEQGKTHGGLGVFAVAFLPDGKHVLTAGGDGAVVLRTRADLVPVRTLAEHTKAVRGLALLPGGKEAVTGGLDAKLCVWDLAAGKARAWTAPAPIQALAVSLDGTRLITGDAAGAVRLWDVATHEEIVHFDGHEGVNAVAFTPDGRRAVTGGSDGVVRLWDLPK
jgi:WD40 repeat protein